MQAEIVDEKAMVVASSAELERQRFMPVMNMDMALERRAVIKKAIGSLLEEGGDFGVIPGTGTKPTLLQPGAQKLDSLFGLVPRFELVDKCEDWTGVDHGGEPFFRYLTRCVLYRGDFAMGEGLGECNSWESKYRWRKSERVCPDCGKSTIIKGKKEYGGGWLCFAKKGGCGAKFPEGDAVIESQETGRVPNGDIFDQVNTLLKMANKRAHVAATINTTSASEFFTQDMEDANREPSWTEGTAAAKSVAEQKLAAMRNGAQYEEVSSRDERRDSPVTVMRPPEPKPPFNMSKSIEEFQKLHQFACDSLGKEKGDAVYYGVLANHGAEHANQIKSAKPARECYRVLVAEIDAAISYQKSDADEFYKHMAANEPR